MGEKEENLGLIVNKWKIYFYQIVIFSLYVHKQKKAGSAIRYW